MAPIPDDDASRHVRAHTRFLSSADLSLLELAFDAGDRGQWDYARTLASRLSNAAARDLVLWRAFTTKDNGAAFADIDRFIAAHRDWPNQRALHARAEEAMPSDAMQADEVIAWFQGRDPVSGEGMLKLGEAYARKDQDSNARNWIRRAWVEGNFKPERIPYITSRHGAYLSREQHEARVSRLIWAGEYGQAQAMAGRLDAGWSALATARVKLRQNARDADAAYTRVPSGLLDDPGLLFDRARWLRKRDREAEARPLLIRASARMSAPPPEIDDWWAERHYQARAALDLGAAQQAYQIAAGHELRKDAGLPYAEAEFLAGWIALRFLNRPDTAFDHFMKLRDGVTAPISVARAHYWAARAAEKSGRTSEMTRNFELAAGYPMTYYGQLAAVAINPRNTLDLPLARAPASATKQAFMDQGVVQAMQALSDIGAGGMLRTFALASADQYADRDQFVLLTTFLRQLNEPALALRVAKRGLQRNIPVYDIAYPTTSLPVYRGNRTMPESALVLGLTRQESEFDSQALSSAGARGLMQMMPATAKLTARAHGIGYGGKGDLFSPSTNLQLGMAHLSDLLSNFAGSYVLSIASYNAGAGRINQWISTYGDPRFPGADIVDWIERIPFNETRNYVQRVLENTQVYRNILAGRDVPLAIAADLKRGTYASVASAEAQFSSSPAPSLLAPADGATPTPTTAPDPHAQFASVVMGTPIADDEEETPTPRAKPKKKKSKVAKKKKKKRSSLATAANSSAH